MKRVYQLLLGVVLAIVMNVAALAQESPVDRLTVAFSNASRPGLLKVGLMNGGITIKGYEGKEVIVEARVRTQKLSQHKGTKEKEKQKARGMQRIEVTSTGLTVEEEDNVMEIGVSSMNRTIDLTIQVPRKTSLNLSCLNNGDIKVEQVEGEIEVSNTNGGVTLTGVSGSVVAHALNDDVVVTFVRIEPNKAMSFSSLNGDIDVTFPPDLKAKVKMKADNGDVYSDFDIRLEAATNRIEEDARKEGGKYQLKVEKSMYGIINGGGPEIQLATFNGDIYIRKSK